MHTRQYAPGRASCKPPRTSESPCDPAQNPLPRCSRIRKNKEPHVITFEDIRTKRTSIAVVGLGYVGLPLAVSMSRLYSVTGFDVNAARIAELEAGADATGEIALEKLAAAPISFTTDPAAIRKCGLIIVAVPTPIDENRNPDLRPVISASKTVGDNLEKGAVVVFESTVYPGLTEEICLPILEERSGLAAGRDFFIGYSPERINPGDKVHTFETITKVVSGQTPEVAELLAEVYGSVVAAGVHKASSIKVAEAAKVIENTQRDINIALMNELSLIFSRLGIDTLEVLEAAGTKWNFLPFRPGLVGGHCIGVDPYYLTFKAQSMGYDPQVILAGRRINDDMARRVAETAVKEIIHADSLVKGARVGVLGLTFKENVPDLRNTKVVDIVRELEDYRVKVLVHDPMASADEARHEYGLELVAEAALRDLDALILAVSHEAFASYSPSALKSWFKAPDKAVILDIKGVLDRKEAEAQGVRLWRL